MVTRIAVIGAAGRMGRAIIRAIADEGTSARLTAASERPDSPDLGADAGTLAGVAGAPLGVPVRAELPAADAADVWVEFSSPAATVEHVRAAAAARARMVIGTTGLSPTDRQVISEAAKLAAMVVAPNMSVGVNVLLKLVADAARALGPGFDLEVVETHHRAKRDAPSGTALRLAEALAEATGRDLAQTARYARQGDVGPRTAEEIGIQTLRGGDVVGDHTVFFFGMGERIELTHRASSRENFARGAVRAAQWVTAMPPGVYEMRDVLGMG